MFYVQIVALGMRKNKNGIVRVAHMTTFGGCAHRPPTRPLTPPKTKTRPLLFLPPKAQQQQQSQ
jgi:hypothetical protein